MYLGPFSNPIPSHYSRWGQAERALSPIRFSSCRDLLFILIIVSSRKLPVLLPAVDVVDLEPPILRKALEQSEPHEGRTAQH